MFLSFEQRETQPGLFTFSERETFTGIGLEQRSKLINLVTDPRNATFILNIDPLNFTGVLINGQSPNGNNSPKNSGDKFECHGFVRIPFVSLSIRSLFVLTKFIEGKEYAAATKNIEVAGRRLVGATLETHWLFETDDGQVDPVLTVSGALPPIKVGLISVGICPTPERVRKGLVQLKGNILRELDNSGSR